MRPNGHDPGFRPVPPRQLLRPFLLAAVAWLVVAALIGLALAVSWLSGRQPPFGFRLAHAHLALVGAATQAMLGSIPFFGIAMLATMPAGRRMASAQWWLVNVGTIALAVGFVAGWRPILFAGGVLVFLAVALAASTLYQMLRRAMAKARLDLAYYFAAFFFGMVAVAIGLFMAAGLADYSVSYAGLRLAHLHLALVGWVSLTIVGTMHSLFPSILGLPANRLGHFAPTFWLLVAGIPSLTAGFLWYTPLGYVGGLAIAIAAGLFARQVVSFGKRRWHQTGLAGKHLFAASIYFVAVVLGGLAMLAWESSGRTADPRWLVAYGHLALIGWVVQVLIGAMTHLMPVFAGGQLTRPGSGTQGVYLDWHATMAAGSGWQFWLLNGGLLLFAAALLAWRFVAFWQWLAFVGGLSIWAAVVMFASKVITLYVALRRS